MIWSKVTLNYHKFVGNGFYMKNSFDNKAQMMDAGTAFFTSKEGYGSVLGQIKAEMAVFGKVLSGHEIEPAALPYSTKECDLFLDFSTIFRNRYISCKLEDGGSTGEKTEEGEDIRRYAAVLKEGNTGTKLREWLFILIILLLLGCGVSWLASGVWLGIISIAAALVAAYWRIVPSRKAQETVKYIKRKIEADAAKK